MLETVLGTHWNKLPGIKRRFIWYVDPGEVYEGIGRTVVCLLYSVTCKDEDPETRVRWYPPCLAQ